MFQQLTALYRKHREVLLYLVFGGLTTAVNYLVYLACFALLGATTTTWPNLVAWIVSVLFAYVTNRTWVFRSKASGAAQIGRELAAFTGARVLTLVMETLLLLLLVDTLHLPNLPIKLAANLLVIVLNYLFSKFWIFRKRIPPER